MAAKWDKNKKSPKDPISDGKVEPKQGWWFGEANHLGGHSLMYANPNDKENYIHQTLSAHGTYKFRSYDQDEKGFNVDLHVGGVREYTNKSKCTHHDGQYHNDAEKCKLEQAGGDHGFATPSNQYHGVGQNKMFGVGGSELSYNQQTQGTKYSVVNAKTGTMYEDQVHTSYAKDNVTMMKGGNHFIISKEGDIGVDAQGGSWDVNVSKDTRINSSGFQRYISGDTFTGTSKKAMSFASKDTYSASSSKAMSLSTDDTWDASSKKSMGLSSDTSLRTRSKEGTTFEAGEDFMISSDSKITLKVGGSSIEISSGSIKIKSGGEVNIQGSSTKIQGGGVTTWQLPGTPLGPSTFT
jgi:uncharacterized protein YaiE (UPF0345 family)